MESAAEWCRRVKAAENAGDYLFAYDLAMQGLAENPESADLQYLATRTIARSGATDHARDLYARFGLGRLDDRDAEALGARLAKDQALAAPRASRRKMFAAAAAAYARIYARRRDDYSAINAATLSLLAGRAAQARRYAALALRANKRAAVAADAGGSRYYLAATRAEAALIGGDVATARRELEEAARHLGGDFAAAATTRKQLKLVCAAAGIGTDVLDPIRPPAVLHYCAPVLGTRAPDPGDVRALRAEIARYVAREGFGYAYGSLAAGGEIVCAEACLRAGLDLHIVLPFRTDEFVRIAVQPAGAGWVRRFRRCLAGARSVTHATADSYQGDASLFAYGDSLSMGMAILRAQNLDTGTVHLRLDTGGWEPDGRGVAANLRKWRRLGLRSDALKPPHPFATTARPPRKKPRAARRMPPRHAHAILFGDVKGFSKTPDYLIPAFQQHLMGTIAKVLRRYGRRVLYRNSWGDAIYVVIDDAIIGVECALAIQDALKKLQIARYGLSSDLALRLAAHVGPVYDGFDPICDEPTFFGAHATITARMEPVTAPGRVYLTEAMAAALSMESKRRFRADYVGNVPSAKGFGAMRMYALTRASGEER